MQRLFNEKCISKFKERLNSIDWSVVLGNNDCQTAFSCFHEIYLKHYNECFPIVKIKIGYNNKKPWLSLGLKNSIKTKNKLYVV